MSIKIGDVVKLKDFNPMFSMVTFVVIKIDGTSLICFRKGLGKFQFEEKELELA